MKIGQTSGSVQHYPLNERYEKLRSFGYDSVDFQLAATDVIPYTLDAPESEKYIAENRKAIEAAGMFVNQTHGPWCWPPPDDTYENRLNRLEEMKRCLHFTALLGAKYMAVHPIMPYGIQDLKTLNYRATYELNLIYYSKLADAAKEEGVCIGLENMPMPEFSVSSPSDILRIVKNINHDNLKICLDTGHVTMYKDTTPANALRELGSYVKILHIHDNNGQQDWHRMPYDGVIDWADFSKALKEIGYDGVFSLETGVTSKLPEDIFSDMMRTYAKLARSIIEM